jgi:hypothetical protein
MEMALNKNEIVKANETIQRNLGIEMLRMYLCFRIVLLHYYSSNNKYILNLKRNRFQVPCFFFISFYFLFPTISQRKCNKFKQRLERLLIIKFNRYGRFLKLNELITQIIVGRGIYGIAALWFHFNLILFIFCKIIYRQRILLLLLYRKHLDVSRKFD